MAMSMDISQAPSEQADRRTREPATQAEPISPQIVQQVADRVFALMLMDLKIEFERTRSLRTRRR